MATVKTVIAPADGWVELAAAGDDFLVQNTGDAPLHVTLQDSAPGASVGYHTLASGQAFPRYGVGALYGRAGHTERDSVATVSK